MYYKRGEDYKEKIKNEEYMMAVVIIVEEMERNLNRVWKSKKDINDWKQLQELYNSIAYKSAFINADKETQKRIYKEAEDIRKTFISVIHSL